MLSTELSLKENFVCGIISVTGGIHDGNIFNCIYLLNFQYGCKYFMACNESREKQNYIFIYFLSVHYCNMVICTVYSTGGCQLSSTISGICHGQFGNMLYRVGVAVILALLQWQETEKSFYRRNVHSISYSLYDISDE